MTSPVGEALTDHFPDVDSVSGPQRSESESCPDEATGGVAFDELVTRETNWRPDPEGEASRPEPVPSPTMDVFNHTPRLRRRKSQTCKVRAGGGGDGWGVVGGHSDVRTPRQPPTRSTSCPLGEDHQAADLVHPEAAALTVWVKGEGIAPQVWVQSDGKGKEAGTRLPTLSRVPCRPKRAVSSCCLTSRPGGARPGGARPGVGGQSLTDPCASRSLSCVVPRSARQFSVSRATSAGRSRLCAKQNTSLDQCETHTSPDDSKARDGQKQSLSQQQEQTKQQKQTTASRAPSSQSARQRRVPLLVAIKPGNQDVEKDRFFRSGYTYHPQFIYRHSLPAAALERFSSPSDTLLPIAVKVMETALLRYGTYAEFEARTGGRPLSRGQIQEGARRYLRRERLGEEVVVKVTDDLLSRACMGRSRGQPQLQIRTQCMREFWMEGMLRHEIGTHYLRSRNNRRQTWQSWRRRRELGLGPANPTEEGLASLHSVLLRPDPSLWRSALLYYTALHAASLSFRQLFQLLERFVDDPDVRWDYCMRAKRGQRDTSQPGTFSKDQVYLQGALAILKHRQTLDFHLLVRCGKVDFRDLDRLRPLVDLENTRIPGFMTDLDSYRRKLDNILLMNGLTDVDLSVV